MGALPSIMRNGLLILGLAFLSNGCNRQDTECLSRIGRRLVSAAGSAKESLNSSWQGVYPVSLEGRVAARIRWDKALCDTAIEVKANGAEIELKGNITDPNQRQRAMELAESTAGVEKVSDQMQVKESVKEKEE